MPSRWTRHVVVAIGLESLPALVDYVLTTPLVTEIDRDEHRTLYLLAR